MQKRHLVIEDAAFACYVLLLSCYLVFIAVTVVWTSAVMSLNEAGVFVLIQLHLAYIAVPLFVVGVECAGLAVLHVITPFYVKSRRPSGAAALSFISIISGLLHGYRGNPPI